MHRVQGTGCAAAGWGDAELDFQKRFFEHICWSPVELHICSSVAWHQIVSKFIPDRVSWGLLAFLELYKLSSVFCRGGIFNIFDCFLTCFGFPPNFQVFIIFVCASGSVQATPGSAAGRHGMHLEHSRGGSERLRDTLDSFPRTLRQSHVFESRNGSSWEPYKCSNHEALAIMEAWWMAVYLYIYRGTSGSSVLCAHILLSISPQEVQAPPELMCGVRNNIWGSCFGFIENMCGVAGNELDLVETYSIFWVTEHFLGIAGQIIQITEHMFGGTGSMTVASHPANSGFAKISRHLAASTFVMFKWARAEHHIICSITRTFVPHPPNTFSVTPDIWPATLNNGSATPNNFRGTPSIETTNEAQTFVGDPTHHFGRFLNDLPLHCRQHRGKQKAQLFFISQSRLMHICICTLICVYIYTGSTHK